MKGCVLPGTEASRTVHSAIGLLENNAADNLQEQWEELQKIHLDLLLLLSGKITWREWLKRSLV